MYLHCPLGNPPTRPTFKSRDTNSLEGSLTYSTSFVSIGPKIKSLLYAA